MRKPIYKNASGLFCHLVGIFSLLGSLFAGLYLELFHEAVAIYFDPSAQGLITGYASPVIVFRTFLYSAFFCVLFVALRRVPRSVFSYIFKYRYLVAFGLFACAVLLELSFSSIGFWGQQLLGGTTDGLLFGVPRSVRSDEFNVSTLWNFSQEHNGYAAWSEILRGDLTDTRLVYNTASFSLATLFRPLLWGFLFFGSAKGLAFLTVGKLMATFFASFECFRVLSRDDRMSSLVFAVLVTFSPGVLWWSMWEGLIYGQMLVVTLHVLLNESRPNRILLLALLLGWLCGCYVMIIYPAWMVPFFYIFAFMGVLVFVRYKKNNQIFNKRLVLLKLGSTASFLLIAAICILVILGDSAEIMQVTTQTVYPGTRFETGGTVGKELFYYGNSILFPIAQPGFSNASELSSMFSLFPLGSFLACYTLYKTREKDALLLMGIQVFFLIFVTVGVPAFIAKVTLFSNCPSGRVLFAIGYLEIFLLVYSVSRLSACTEISPEKEETPGSTLHIVGALAGSIPIVGVLYALTSEAIPGYERMLFSSLVILLVFMTVVPVLFVMFGAGSRRKAVQLFLWTSFCGVMIPGLCVHPVQKGIAPVTGTDFAHEVSQIVQLDSEAKWIAEGSWPISNLLTALGASTIGSTNAYPDMDIWTALDPEGKSEEIYNRYAHVDMCVTNEETSFEKIGEDLIRVNISLADLNRLGVDYVASSVDWSTNPELSSAYDCLGEANGLKIYQLRRL